MKARVFLSTLTVALVAVSPALGQTSADLDPPAPVHDGARTDGIHVSGLWTITVHDPDGATVRSITFHNALLPNGAISLSETLTGGLVPGLWAVVVQGAVCLDDAAATAACFVVEAADSRNGANVFKTLSETTDGAGTITLQGTLTAQQTGQIQNVGTQLGLCADTTTPADCTNANLANAYFTNKALDTPLDVEDGQVVTVSVEIGFN
jgi:hypothetical protein